MRAKTLVKWHGGKGRLSTWIIGHLPPSRVYVEPFGGGAAVLLNKPASEIEVYNDLDGRIVNLFRVLRDEPDEFRRKVDLVPYSEAEFQLAAWQPPWISAVDRAVADFVRFRQSFGGKGTPWSYGTKRARQGVAENVHAYRVAIEGLPWLVERVQRWQILSRSAVEVIGLFNDPEAVIYCDPPYVHATRRATAVYGHEMTDDQHRELAAVLNKCRAKVAVSGYPSALYAELFKGWRCETRDVGAHAAGGCKKQRMTEALWLNYG